MPFRTPDHVRASERRRYRRLTDERLAAELCPNCGLRPPAPDRRRCEVCGEQQRVADRARYARAKAEGSHSAKARSAIPSPTDFLSALSFLRWPLVKVLSSIPLDDFSFMIPPAVSRLEAAARLYRRRLRPARRRPRDGALPCSQAIRLLTLSFPWPGSARPTCARCARRPRRRGGHRLRGLSLLDDAAHRLGSTARREFCILMGVHPGLSSRFADRLRHPSASENLPRMDNLLRDRI